MVSVLVTYRCEMNYFWTSQLKTTTFITWNPSTAWSGLPQGCSQGWSHCHLKWGRPTSRLAHLAVSRFSSSRAVGWKGDLLFARGLPLCSWPCKSLQREAHDTATGAMRVSKQEGERENMQASWKLHVSSNLTSDVAFFTFVIFYSREASHEVQPTLRLRGSHRVWLSGYGDYWESSEGSDHHHVLMNQAAKGDRNLQRKKGWAVGVYFLTDRSCQMLWKDLFHPYWGATSNSLLRNLSNPSPLPSYLVPYSQRKYSFQRLCSLSQRKWKQSNKTVWSIDF